MFTRMALSSVASTVNRGVDLSFTIMEGVIELFSHRDDRASRIVSAFVVGDSDDKAKAQGETPAPVRGRGLGRAFARGRSPSLIR